MHILLTGSNGFIGSHVARQLIEAGDEVTALVRPGSDLGRIEDLRSSLRLVEGEIFGSGGVDDLVSRFRPDACFHLAWHVPPGEYLQAAENMHCAAASMRFLQALRQSGCRRVVMAGTCFEYDTDAGYLTETTPARPQTLYAASKLGVFLMAEQYLRQHEVGFAWARIFYPYGPHEDVRRLVPTLITKLLDGVECPLTEGNQVRDYLHVQDVAGALSAILKSDVTGAVNVGSARPITVADLARTIGQQLGREELLRFGLLPARGVDPPFICADTSRLRTTTGWTPKYSLHTGLADSIQWWKSYRNLMKGQ